MSTGLGDELVHAGAQTGVKRHNVMPTNQVRLAHHIFEPRHYLVLYERLFLTLLPSDFTPLSQKERSVVQRNSEAVMANFHFVSFILFPFPGIAPILLPRLPPFVPTFKLSQLLTSIILRSQTKHRIYIFFSHRWLSSPIILWYQQRPPMVSSINDITHTSPVRQSKLPVTMKSNHPDSLENEPY